jgi:DNA adenine methylase
MFCSRLQKARDKIICLTERTVAAPFGAAENRRSASSSMLRRLGNKTRLLPKLLALFPEHITTFIDMFMGSGAVTFAMVDRAKYIIANDNDEEVFNLFMAVKEHQRELAEILEIMPIHDRLFKYWKKQQEHDCVWRAARFVMLSNFGLFGKPDSLRVNAVGDSKAATLHGIIDAFKAIQSVQLLCVDFRKVLSTIHWKDDLERKSTFMYADPPYIATESNYKNDFTEQDTQDLFEILVNSGLRFALSEFDNPFVLELAQKYGLHVTELGERRNLKNRRTEILITNYEPVQKQPSLFHGLSLN